MKKVEFLLSEVEIQKLKGIVERKINNIKINVAGILEKKEGCNLNWGLLFCLICEGMENIVIYNEPIKIFNREDFPKLKVVYESEYPGDFDHHLNLTDNFKEALGEKWVEEKVNTIEVINDKIKWLGGNDEWYLNIDVGVLISLYNGYKIFVVLRHSSAGIMEIYYGLNFSWIMKRENIEELYFIDPKEIIYINRSKMDITDIVR